MNRITTADIDAAYAMSIAYDLADATRAIALNEAYLVHAEATIKAELDHAEAYKSIAAQFATKEATCTD